MKTLTKNYLVALLTSDYFLKDFKHIDKLDIITTDNATMDGAVYNSSRLSYRNIRRLY